jgi:hypothetical protein
LQFEQPTVCTTKKEVVLMRRDRSNENRVPANRRPLALYALLAIIFLIVVLATVIVVPGRVFGWIATYLIPMGVILGVVLWVFALVGRGGGKDYDDGNAYDKFYHRF